MLPSGKALRAQLYRTLAPRDPTDIDRLTLWQVGGLLRMDMQPPPPEDQAEAAELLRSRAERVREVQERRKHES